MEENKYIKISELCKKVCSGGTPKSSVTSYYDGNIPWLNTKEINFNRIYSTERNITEEGLNNSSAKWIEKNAVVVAMYGATAGKSAISKIPLTTNQACCNLMIDPEKADYRFVYYALASDYNRLASLANGGAQQNLNAQQIKDFEIPKFTLEEQKRIADFLSSLDDKIELNRQINDNLEQQAQALFKSWFVNNKKDSWAVGRVSDFYDVTIGKTPPRKETQWFSSNCNDVTWVSISDLGSCGMFINQSSEYLTPEAIKQFNVSIVPKGTVLLSFKLTIGRIAISDINLTTNEAIAHFRTDKDYLLEYTYLALKDYQFSTLGSTSSIATAINSKIIKSMEWIMPFDEDLKGFHALVNPIFEQIKTNITEINNLTQLRDTLLPRLMSGELKINEINC